MTDSLGGGSEGVIFDQTLTCLCSIQKSHPFEVGVGLVRGLLVLCSASVMGPLTNLLEKQGIENC